MNDPPRFRLKQHGIPVAWAEGTSARKEIEHYALVYSQDAPVSIEQRINGRWKKIQPS